MRDIMKLVETEGQTVRVQITLDVDPTQGTENASERTRLLSAAINTLVRMPIGKLYGGRGGEHDPTIDVQKIS